MLSNLEARCCAEPLSSLPPLEYNFVKSYARSMPIPLAAVRSKFHTPPPPLPFNRHTALLLANQTLLSPIFSPGTEGLIDADRQDDYDDEYDDCPETPVTLDVPDGTIYLTQLVGPNRKQFCQNHDSSPSSGRASELDDLDEEDSESSSVENDEETGTGQSVRHHRRASSSGGGNGGPFASTTSGTRPSSSASKNSLKKDRSYSTPLPPSAALLDPSAPIRSGHSSPSGALSGRRPRAGSIKMLLQTVKSEYFDY